MTKRRSRGDGGLHWDDNRKRWIATASLGFDSNGKRLTKRASGKTKTEAKDKLKEILRDLDDGLPVGPDGYTVADAVNAWLAFGLNGRSAGTVSNYHCLAEKHIVPKIGWQSLRKLSAEDVDKWLAGMTVELSTRTLRLLHSLLSRAVKHAQARDKVKRNVVALCEIPTGLDGRPSKALTLEQAEAVLNAARNSPYHAYIVLSILLGARTEELRALTWDCVDLVGKPDADEPMLPSIAVWYSVREGGDTKTRKSRRTLAMPTRCVEALAEHRDMQDARRKAIRQRQAAGGPRAIHARWEDNNLVFASEVGSALDSHNVRRGFRRVLKDAGAGLVPGEWTPREMRHSFVSLLSSEGVRLEDIARLVGHSGTAVTEAVYRHQIKPVMEEGATAMDRIFPGKPKP
ncbi:site-specific integrase [Kutzneria sp. 744]|uniref:site-specific integrase n=1 Tax=Kutzneria sp. (strain 744) TaxID=345341 RepID=UPI0003EEB348|nr:site-specific integrase [Kutzneria sp. 744]EWM19231.1 integrase [Kutzneria sp. 744]